MNALTLPSFALPMRMPFLMPMSAGKILVIDDDPQIRRVMKVILSGERYEVVEARSGEAALEKFREFLPDLVLLDLNMPGMGGLDTCRSSICLRTTAP